MGIRFESRSHRAEQRQNRLLALAVFAVAMAYLEAAVVVYLRAVYGINDVVGDTPTNLDPFTIIEIGREAATLVMLLAVGRAVSRNWLSSFAFGAFAFGIWDIWYYVWLRVFLGWPASILDWDILFLIPVQWWGPVLAPVLIALLMAVAGGNIGYRIENGARYTVRIQGLILLILGSVVALYSFWADSIAALPGGLEALLQVKPSVFQWPVFLVGYSCLVAGAALIIRWNPTPAQGPSAVADSLS